MWDILLIGMPGITASNGENELNFSMKKGDKVTFKYRLVVAAENLSDAQINKMADEYAKK